MKKIQCALFVFLFCFCLYAEPVNVFILAGQSNMQGSGKISTLPHMAMDHETKTLHDLIYNEGNYYSNPKVRIAAISESRGQKRELKSGPLSIGYGVNLRSVDTCGPELAFGITMFESLKAPILIIKTAWGGKSLYNDFRPPSSGPFSHVNKKNLTSTGHYYREMISFVNEVIDNLADYHPDYDEKSGYKLGGFAWFQGWNDMVDSTVYPNRNQVGGYDRYTENLGHFIRDVRKEFKSPDLPFAIGIMGVGGPTKYYKKDQLRYKNIHQYFRDAMAATAFEPEFKNKVHAVFTEKFWPIKISDISKKKKESLSKEEKSLLQIGKSNAAYHYMGSLKCFSQIGQALAEAIYHSR